MLMGGDERDPASAGAGKKKPNVRLCNLLTPLLRCSQHMKVGSCPHRCREESAL